MTIETGADLFAIKEIRSYDDGENRRRDDEYFVDSNDEKTLLFTSREAAEEWMREQEMHTEEQLCASLQQEHDAAYEKAVASYKRSMRKYRGNLIQYEADIAEAQRIIDSGVPARMVTKPVKPVEPVEPERVEVSRFWYPSIHYEIAPATVVR